MFQGCTPSICDSVWMWFLSVFYAGGFEAWALLGDSGESKETVFVRSRNILIGSFIESETYRQLNRFH